MRTTVAPLGSNAPWIAASIGGSSLLHCRHRVGGLFAGDCQACVNAALAGELKTERASAELRERLPSLR